jgi:hypothetical protein
MFKLHGASTGADMSPDTISQGVIVVSLAFLWIVELTYPRLSQL